MSRRRSRPRVGHHARSSSDWSGSSGEPDYPLATVAYYGPNDRLATKVVVGIVIDDSGDVAHLERWQSKSTDVRYDLMITQQIGEFIESHGGHSVIVTDRSIGCPHEEGVDYPMGESCPYCPFWTGRDRWTGELIH